jgi:hypothetical protein
MTTVVALVEDGGTFICTAQLLGVVADLFVTALFARESDDTGCVHVVLGNGLNFGALCAECRGESGGLRVGDDRLGGGVYGKCQDRCWRLSAQNVPLHEAPQMEQVRIAFCLPALPSSRLPQSVQKTREPMADMLRFGDVFGVMVMW